MKKCVYLFMAAILLPQTSFAQGQEDMKEVFNIEQVSKGDIKTLKAIEAIVETPDEVEELCNKFMDNIFLGEVKEAFDLLEPYFPYSKESFIALKEKTWKKLRFIDLKIGSMLGYDLARKEIYADRIAKFVYIARYNDYMFQWTFIMMKPDKVWRVKSIYWDEELLEVFN